MNKNAIFLKLTCLSLLSLMFISCPIFPAECTFTRLSSKENEIVSQVNGTNAYSYALELERIALKHYAFRSAGSPGANETAWWIKEKFDSFGLETSMEPFDFTYWNLLDQPVLIIDRDKNASTADDQVRVNSFCSTHYSWPTPRNGTFSDLVILELPETFSRRGATGWGSYNASAWNAINLTGKILLVGMEIRWDRQLYKAYRNKLKAEPPAAVIYTWWYQWMSFTPPFLYSVGGLPGDSNDPYYWDLKIPVGCVSYEDGLYIRNLENSINVSANFTIPAEIGIGPHYNVIGKLKGSVDPEKFIVVSAHYDTIPAAGFCDNGAGTAGVLELARVFSKAAHEGIYVPQQTILFIAFGSEEIGLVGSINYIKQHKSQMKDITAVINIDCIGSDTLEVSETCSANGFDLDEIVLKAASDLNVVAELVEPGGSDNEAFQYPKEASRFCLIFGFNAGIDDAAPVAASTGLFSNPLFPTDSWRKGAPGWIHTQYDNSTSTSTLNWVEVDDLEAHIRVAALSILRLLSHVYNPFLFQVTIAASVVGILAVAVTFFKWSYVKVLLTKLHNRIYDAFLFMESRGVVYAILLSLVFILVFSLGSMHFEKIEVVKNNVPKMVYTVIWGFPLKMA